MRPLQQVERGLNVSQRNLNHRHRHRGHVTDAPAFLQLLQDGPGLVRPAPQCRHLTQSGVGQHIALRVRHRLPEGGSGFVVQPLLGVDQPQEPVGFLGGRIHGQCPAQVLQGGVEIPGIVVQPPHAAPDGDRKRIELDRGPAFGERFVEPAHGGQKPGVPLARRRVAGIQLDGPGELAFGGSPVPVIDEDRPSPARYAPRPGSRRERWPSRASAWARSIPSATGAP